MRKQDFRNPPALEGFRGEVPVEAFITAVRQTVIAVQIQYPDATEFGVCLFLAWIYNDRPAVTFWRDETKEEIRLREAENQEEYQEYLRLKEKYERPPDDLT
jgi:hypothetical protein